MRELWQKIINNNFLLLISGGIVSAILIIYTVMVLPLTDNFVSVQKQVAQKKELLLWMQVNSRELQKKRRQQPQLKKFLPNAALLTKVEDSLKRWVDLQKKAKVTQAADKQVNVVFDKVLFDELVTWLDELWRKYDLDISKISIIKMKEDNQVQATLTLRAVQGA